MTHTEDNLVQAAAEEFFREELGWETYYAYNNELFGEQGTLGRQDDSEVVLSRYLRQALEKFNPGLPAVAYEQAIGIIVAGSVSKSMVELNKDKHSLLRTFVTVTYTREGKQETKKLRVFDFDNPEANHFLAVREFWVQGAIYHKRCDVVGFVNGIPLLFVELKNIHKDIRLAYDVNFTDYKKTIPHLFHHNAFVVLGNGHAGKLGSITSKYDHFMEWKRQAEEDDGDLDFFTLLKGVCDKKNFLDMFENFIVFDDSFGKTVKIIARNHQFLGVNRAFNSVQTRKGNEGQLGVFWHTQGSGKSYSMVFFCEKVHRKLGGNYTFVMVTDRQELDGQLHKTFVGCGAVAPKSGQATSGKHLRELLGKDERYVFTLIQKFNEDMDSAGQIYTDRPNVIVISDEAHRSQYGQLALNMRNVLPNAAFIGFTGTPLFKNDEITRQVFGDYISVYDFKRAVDDNATVPLYYENRGEKLGITHPDLNARIAAKLEEFDLDPDQQAKLERELAREYPIMTAGKRLDAIARDFVVHYVDRWETGKAMFVALDKVTAVRMHKLIAHYWQEQAKAVEAAADKAGDEQAMMEARRKAAWMRETEICVVISEEQNEVAKFEAWDLDITTHRERIKKGFTLADGKSCDIESAFKNGEHPFRVAIVCAMWLTGFDVPTLATLYLDKPLQGHTLMQTIARANRVAEDKENGLIVDYVGVLKSLRQALATYTGGAGGTPGEGGEDDPCQPKEKQIAAFEEAIREARAHLKAHGFNLDDLIKAGGAVARLKAIMKGQNAINTNEQSRKKFEILARAVFTRFKAMLPDAAATAHRPEYDAIDILYKKLMEQREVADITAVLRELHKVVDDGLILNPDHAAEPEKRYDISNIDFDRLRKEFEKTENKNTAVIILKDAVEAQLQRMLANNPLRKDYFDTYRKIIDEYNKEQDRATIEKTWQELLDFIEKKLTPELERAAREELTEQQLTVFDLLLAGTPISPSKRDKMKAMARELLDALEAEKLKVPHWPEKTQIRGAIEADVRDYLYAKWPDDGTFSDDLVAAKTEMVMTYLYSQYGMN